MGEEYAQKSRERGDKLRQLHRDRALDHLILERRLIQQDWDIKTDTELIELKDTMTFLASIIAICDELINGGFCLKSMIPTCAK